MNSSIKKKVNGIGLAGKIVSIILIVCMGAACFGCLSGGVALAAMPKDSLIVGISSDVDIKVGTGLIGRWMNKIPDDPAELDAKLNLNGTEYVDMNMEKTADGLIIRVSSDRIEFDLKRLVSAVCAGFVYCAALLVVFVFLLRLSDAFRKCDSPFDDLVIKRMNIFAWVLVGASVVSSVSEAIANSLLARSLDLSFSLNPSNMNTGFEVSFSFAPILIALIVLFLTVIFRYGAKLQREADETL